MSEINELYQELILDHYARPRHRGPLPGANREAEGYNPLCGDQVRLRLVVDDGVIRDIAFEGGGCAISTAAASVMAEAVLGKTVDDALALFDQMMPALTGTADLPADADPSGKLAAFAGVRDYPMRVKCATLAWHTLHEALAGADATAAAATEA
jgi:nitrogen fixation protein NifU and related proteins